MKRLFTLRATAGPCPAKRPWGLTSPWGDSEPHESKGPGKGSGQKGVSKGHYGEVHIDPIDESLSKALVAYLKSLTVTQGRHAGQKFKVLPWQRDFVMGAFESKTRSAALSVARGNGKTTLVAGIACAILDGPLMVPRGQTILVASSFEQARIAFEHCLAFMGDKLGDKSVWKVWDTAQQARIENRETGAMVRCIGSDSSRAHGHAPSLVLADEPAQWGPHNDRMLAALKTAAGKQPGSRFIALGTRPADPEHWFSKMLQEAPIGGNSGKGFRTPHFRNTYKGKLSGAKDTHHFVRCYIRRYS